MEYKLWETSPIGSKTKYPPQLVKLSFIISSGEYEKKEHYFIYSGNALIADIGGYMGLLLGFSIYSIIKSVMESTVWGGAGGLLRGFVVGKGNSPPKSQTSKADQFRKANGRVGGFF